MGNARKSLAVCVLAVLASTALLIGSTFAWFTDSVTNRGNEIESGTLAIALNGGDETPLFQGGGFLWEPGSSQNASAALSNEGSLWLKYTVAVDNLTTDDTIAPAADITEVLDVYRVEGKASGEVSDADLTDANKLGTLAELTAEGGTLGTGVLAPKGYTGQDGSPNATFTLVIKMQESAGNEYQGARVGFDIVVRATQYTHEADGFGNSQYDAAAGVETQEEFLAAAEKGGNITLWDDIDLDNGLDVTQDTTIDLGGNAITFDGAGIIDVSGDATLTIRGDGALEQLMTSELGYLIRAEENAKVVIEDGLFAGGLTCVQAGDNAVVEIYGGRFESLVGYSGTNWHLNLIDNSNASIVVYGGTFVNFDPSNSRTENPAANFVADGYATVSQDLGNGDILYTVVQSQAIASEDDLLAAISGDAADVSHLVLGGSISSNGNIDFKAGKTIAVDFAGNTLESSNGNIALRVNGSTGNDYVTLSNGTIVADDNTYCTVGLGSGVLNLNDMSLRNSRSFGVSVKAFGGTINLNNVDSVSLLGGGMEACGGVINVNGGTFTQTGFYDWNSCIGAASGNTGTLNLRDVMAESENYGLYIFSSGGTINVYSGSYTAGRAVLKGDLDLNSYPTASGAFNIYGGSFDGKLEINSKIAVNIYEGTFANTGMTLEQFEAYVADGSTVSENNGVFTVTQ